MTSKPPAIADDKLLYRPPGHPVLLEVPAFEFVMIDGSGDPNTSPDHQAAVSALYSVSYPVVMTLKKAGRTDLKVRPLEGLWWSDDLAAYAPATQDRSAWRWTMMIRQPDAVPDTVYETAMEKMIKKVGQPVAGRVRVERFDEGLCAQLMHRGPYDEEGPDIERLHQFIRGESLQLRGHHHEIYVSDPRRVAPERMRTVLRQPVAR